MSAVNEKYEEKLSKAKNYAYRLLSYRSRSCEEIRERLKRKGFSGKIIDRTVSNLKSLNYLNDMQFSSVWIETRFSTNPCGRKFVEQQLRKKGISEEIIKDTCEEAFSGNMEHELALNLARRKLARYTDTDRKTKWKKLYSLLGRRGFPLETVREVISETLGEYE